jgi:hypothetical protein
MKRRGNVRVILCGIEEENRVEVDRLRLYITKVWKKKTQKITHKYVDIAVKRFKSLLDQE